MKNTLKSVRALAATLITFGSLAGGVNAAVIVSMVESGPDLVFSWSGGSLDLTGLVSNGPDSGNVAFSPADGSFFTNAAQDSYSGSFTVSPYGTLTYKNVSDVWSGVALGYNHFSETLRVSENYVSGSTYGSGSITLSGYSFASTGIVPGSSGTLVSWGSDSIDYTTVPEPSSAVFLGLVAIGVAVLRRRIN